MINSNMEHCAAMAQSQGSSLYEYLQWKLDQAPTNDPVMMRQRFKMSVLINPTKDFSDDHLRHFLYHDGAWGVSYYDLDAMKRDEDQGRTLVSFNLHKSLEEQLRFARSYLEDLQDDLKGEAVIRRPRKSNWPLFLRAIDARDVDATFDEMAKAFWPGQEKTPQSARDAYLAACQLREKFPI
jgi:hypothetical protein